MMKKLLEIILIVLAVIAIIVLIGIGTSDANAQINYKGKWPTHDMWGNKLPEECRRDLSNVEVHVRFTDLSGYATHGRILGFFLEPKGGAVPVVLVDDKITNHKLQDHVLHHEYCHAVMWFKYGNYRWHP